MQFLRIDGNTTVTSFSTPAGATEVFIHAGAGSGIESFDKALDMLASRISAAFGMADIDASHCVFSRIYLSNIAGRAADVRASALYRTLSAGVISIIGQAPLDQSPVSVLVWCVATGSRQPLARTPVAPAAAAAIRHSSALFRGAHYSMLVSGNVSSPARGDAEEQTRHFFEHYSSLLLSGGMTLAGNLLRTWVFVRDIDNNYQGMVKARREHFAASGLTPQHRYPASTGIEGDGEHAETAVVMDALALRGLSEKQIVRMEALDHMSPTINYGVTFERGLRLRFGDRSHLHVSGTASIDSRGNVVHEGDVCRQADRTIENMTALLAPHCATLNDCAYIVMYLKDAAERDTVLRHISGKIPATVPVVALQAGVCRPYWLVEMEGVAVIGDNGSGPPFF